MQQAATAIAAAARDYFSDLRRSLTKQLQDAIGQADKADSDLERRVQRILDELDFEGNEAFVDIVREELRQLYADGAAEAARQVGFDVDAALRQVNTEAVAFARDRSAEMVGMRVRGGELVPNPNAKWRIDDGTREMLRHIVRDGLEEGFSNDRLADALVDVYAFSETRAETIARTETARADVQGNLAGYRAAGVGRKQWLTAPECCDECQELDGEIVGLDEDFPRGGGSGAPLHPNCRCDLLPVIDD